jgi:putative transposase
MKRHAAKAQELGVGERTLRRWVAQYEGKGEAGLVDSRQVEGRRSKVDPRWEQACMVIMKRNVKNSTLTAGALLRQVNKHLDEQYGEESVPRPSQATAYRHLTRLAKGTNSLKGSAKGRRSIDERPERPYGRLRAARPGEYAILDTQSLDVFAMEPVTCRWVEVQLTVVQNLFTRCITGLRVTPVAVKGVDVAGVLYESMVPRPAPRDWPAEAYWTYHGIPRHLVFTETGAVAGRANLPAGDDHRGPRQGVPVGTRDQRVHPAGDHDRAGPAEEANRQTVGFTLHLFGSIRVLCCCLGGDGSGGV